MKKPKTPNQPTTSIKDETELNSLSSFFTSCILSFRWLHFFGTHSSRSRSRIGTMATFDVYSAASSMLNPYSSFMTVEDSTAAIISTAPTRKRWREETKSWDVDDQQHYNEDDDDIMVASKSPRTQYHHPDPSSFMHNSTTTTSTYDSYVVSAAQPIVTVLQSEGAKRPQLKYDPDVPMTKEQTRAWRRDQRRRRNRESAAACRKRQRDAIFVLEAEVAVWKAKFDNALSKIQERDGECAAAELQAQIESRFVMPTTTHHRQMRERSSSCATPPPNEAHVPDEIYSSMGMHNNMVHPSNVISPYEQPQFISYHASTTSTTYHHQHHHELHFPVLDDDAIAKANHGAAANPDEFKNSSRVEKRQHLNEIITRPAQSRLLPLVLLSNRGLGRRRYRCRRRIEFHSLGVLSHHTSLTQ